MHAIYGDYGEDQWVCRVAETPEEAKELLEVGFEYVNDVDGKHLYRKRKQ